MIEKHAFEKTAEVIADSIVAGNNDMAVVNDFQKSGDYIRRFIREGSLSEKMLPVKSIEIGDEGVHPFEGSDHMYYMDDVEVGGLAMQTTFRAESKPIFVDSLKYKIVVDKIETEEIKKPLIELEVAKNLIRMIEQNSKESIERVQDSGLMRSIRYAVESSFTGFEDRTITADWEQNFDKMSIIQAKNIFARMELRPQKIVMSDIGKNWLATPENDAVNVLSAELFTSGYNKDTISALPYISTIKSKLDDPGYEYDAENSLAFNTKNFFDYTIDGDVYTTFYIMADPEFLGKIIKWRTDKVWSKIEKDMFFWQAWRYVGHGFGDIRGLVRVVAKIGTVST